MHNEKCYSLYEALLKRYENPDDMHLSILKVGLEFFNLPLGVISQTDGTSHHITTKVSNMKFSNENALMNILNTSQLSEGEVITIERPVHNSVRKNPSQSRKIACVITAPIIINNKTWGAISFASNKIRENGFTYEDEKSIKLMAKSIELSTCFFMATHLKNIKINALEKNNNILENIFKNSSIGMALVSPNGQWVKVNNSLIEMLGYSEEYLLSIGFKEITHVDDLMEDLKQMKMLAQGNIPFYQLEKRYLTAEGRFIWVLLSVSVTRKENGDVRYFIAQIQNIDIRKKMEIELNRQREELHNINIILERMATEDSLTEIANRRKFMLWFDSEISKPSLHPVHISLAIADIDYFKSYNDDYGHQEGDFALKSIAKELSQSLRGFDKLARYGGEEFIILLANTDEHTCHLVCERLRHSIESIKTLRRTVTISIGAVTFTNDNKEKNIFDNLFKIADSCLYKAKRMGRNRVVVAKHN